VVVVQVRAVEVLEVISRSRPDIYRQEPLLSLSAAAVLVVVVVLT